MLTSSPDRGCGVSLDVRRVWLLTFALAGIVVALFLLVDPVMPSLVARPDWLDAATPTVAVASVALLAGDVALPIPSSVLMVGNGAVFGLALGTLLSTLGATLSAVIGHTIGRTARSRSCRWLGAEAADRLDAMLARHGFAAVIASRPVPIAAEVVAVLAGQGGMPLRAFAASAALGAAGIGAVYAAAGTLALAGAGVIAIAVAVLVAATTWLYGRHLTRRRSNIPGAHRPRTASRSIDPRSADTDPSEPH
jgi:uncharacterized membrane protein YdjX (TVP38/TMEM64 family)